MRYSKKILLIAQLLIAKNNFIEIILNAATNKHAINMDYVTKTANELKNYIVVPLEIKQRKLTNGTTMVLYAEDVNDSNRTKSFILDNIKRVNELNKSYRTKHPIKIHQNADKVVK